MITPPFSGGMSFSEAADGDLRNDADARRVTSIGFKIADQWATVRQIHGATVHRVQAPGVAGEGDALWTVAADLPVAVFTADCFGVILGAEEAVGVAHAGWRGVAAGVVPQLRAAMAGNGYPPVRAAIGPGIGPCCFEVGPEVAKEFPDYTTRTTWGTVSVDLESALEHQLEGIETWIARDCTRHEDGWFSHRRDQTRSRLATIGWL
jgi:purine-nucleoside/S-methyl-5'-thioadenosine phosphorylase / adenosine deaminase